MPYNQDKAVRDFYQKHGLMGELVLGVFNMVNPMRCPISGSMRSDEYLGHAARFVARLNQAARYVPAEVLSLPVLEEVARRSFSIQQVAKGFVSPEAIQEIALNIALGIFVHPELQDDSRWKGKLIFSPDLKAKLQTLTTAPAQG